MILRIFSSSRKIKEYQEKAKAKNALLDSAFLVSDFLDRVCVHPLKQALMRACF